MISRICGFLLLIGSQLPAITHSFSSENSKTTTSGIISRRDWWKWSAGIGGTVIYGKLVGDVYRRLSRGVEYPPEHESRVESVIETCMQAAASQQSLGARDTLRILEVGIGVDARLIRRKLYQRGIQDMAKEGLLKQVQLTGIDLHQVKLDAERDAKSILDQIGAETGVRISFQSLVGDAVSAIPYPDGFFDVVVCCLTLCSVTDQTTALEEMKRVVRPNGGTFGYVEHVAVEPTEPYRFLEWQQQALDPLQQLLAENCHLHRYTEQSINNVFGVSSASPHPKNGAQTSRSLQRERFLVKDMWPVTCQTCGVIQRIS